MSNSPSETPSIPILVRKQGDERTFVYTGSSMTPTFQPGHLLYVRPTGHDLVPGDVVVYSGTEKDGYVVHRVVAATQDGLLTRGDNNPQNDTSPVTYQQVIGRVESAEFGGKLNKVVRGRRGLWMARLRHAVRVLSARLCVTLGAPYRALKASPLARQRLKRLFKPRFEFIRLQTPHGPLLKVIHHGRLVARCLPATGCFDCRKPYDLFLSESDLHAVSHAPPSPLN